MRYSLALLVFCLPLQAVAEDGISGVDYSVVYVRVPLDGAPTDEEGGRKRWLQETHAPAVSEPGTELWIRHPDGTDELLYKPEDENNGIFDPTVSLDGSRVYFTETQQHPEWEHRDRSQRFKFSNIFAVDVETREVEQLTFSTERRHHNTGACEVPGGRLIFTSSRNDLSVAARSSPNHLKRGEREPHMQLFALQLSDPAGTVEQVGYLNLRGALHPTLLMDGRIMWSTLEDHSMRASTTVNWGLWASLPDGRTWEPLWSALGQSTGSPRNHTFHFQSQAPNGRIQLAAYYFGKDSGYGNLFDFLPGRGFGPPDAEGTPVIRDASRELRYPFQPVSSVIFDDEPQTRSLTPWAFMTDGGRGRVGVSHPSGAPDGVLVSSAYFIYPEGNSSRRQPGNAGIYLIPGGNVVESHDEMVKVIDTDEWLEAQPRALLPWKEIYGSDPVEHPWLPDSEGIDYGFVGSSGVYARESRQVRASFDAPFGHWGQGADTTDFNNSDIHAVRFLHQLPTPKEWTYLSRDRFWDLDGVERMGVLGEIPLRKFDAEGNPIMDSAGDPDTSFLAKVPADISWTFQLLDEHGRVLTHSPTWHQVRPAETRTDCRGCHAHHKPGIEFEGTAASLSEWATPDLTGGPRFVEWHRDVKPILEDNCMGCHSGEDPAGDFAIDDDLRLSDQVMTYRSTRSRLVQAILGEIEDLPHQMPLDADPLSAEDIWTIATWIDVGMPVNKGGFFDYGAPEEGEPPLIFDAPDPPSPPTLEDLKAELEACRMLVAELEVLNEMLEGENEILVARLEAARADLKEVQDKIDQVMDALAGPVEE